MRIRFKTLDGLMDIKECPDVDIPVSRVMSPMWQGAPTPDGKHPERFQDYRVYEFNGEIIDGIPTVEER